MRRPSVQTVELLRFGVILLTAERSKHETREPRGPIKEHLCQATGKATWVMLLCAKGSKSTMKYGRTWRQQKRITE